MNATGKLSSLILFAVFAVFAAGCGPEAESPQQTPADDEVATSQAALTRTSCVYPWTTSVSQNFYHPEVIGCGGPYTTIVTVRLTNNNGTSASIASVSTAYYPYNGTYTQAGVSGAATAVWGPRASGGSYAHTLNDVLGSKNTGTVSTSTFNSPALNYSSGQVVIQKNTASGTDCNYYTAGYSDYIVLKKC